MKSAKTILILFCFSIAFCGCKKDAVEIHPDLLGIWNSDSGNKLIIKSDEKSSYTIGIYPNAKTEQGKAKIKNDRLKVGHAELHITSYPAYDSDGNYYFLTDEGKFYGAYAVLNPAATVSGNDVTFSWTNVVSPEGWSDGKRIEYKLTSSSTWMSFGADWSPSSYLLTGLAPGIYEWRIKSIRETVSSAGTHYSGYSPIQTFIIN
jgi:hypothetical protein